MKSGIIFAFTLLSVFIQTPQNNLNAQIKKAPSPIIWYTIEQADSICKSQAKPMLIDVYTEWCSWCKHMMKTTFASPGIAGYINRHFIPVAFDAETFDTIVYRGNTYINKGEGRKPKHELAKLLLNGRYSFPTIVYTDINRNLYPVPGYQDVKNIEPYLIFFSEQVYTNVPLDNFIADFMFSYRSRFEKEISKALANKSGNFSPPDTSGILQTYSFEEAETLSKQNSKPVFIIAEVNWCNSCKVFNQIILRNPNVTKLLNSKFYTVMFNAAAQEDIQFMGQNFKAGPSGHPHQLSRALFKQSFLFPAFITVNAKGQVISELHGYMGSEQTTSILGYFSDENYTKMTFEEYLKNKKTVND